MGFVSLSFIIMVVTLFYVSDAVKGEKGFLPLQLCDIEDILENSYIRKCCVNDRSDVFCLPLFSIVGAMKCATGILRKWLNLHPQLISGSGLKFAELPYVNKTISTREVHFFSSSENGAVDCRKKCTALTQLEYIKHYRTHFKTHEVQSSIYYNTFMRPGNKTWKFTFDKSPDYMRSVCALEALKCTTPDIKIIIILRNPTERSLSEFNHHCRHRRYRLQSASGRIHFDHEHSKTINVSQDESTRVLYPCTAADFHDFLFHPCYRSDSCEVASVLSKHSEQGGDWHHNGHSKQSEILSLHIRALQNSSNEDYEMVSIPLQREIAHGFFDEQLLSVLTIFQPERVLILLQEDMRRSLKDTLFTVESFLGLQHFEFHSDPAKSSFGFLSRMFNALTERIGHLYYPSRSISPHASKKMKMLPDTRRLLDQIYSTHNRRLRELLEMSSNPQHRQLLKGQGADWLRRS